MKWRTALGEPKGYDSGGKKKGKNTTVKRNKQKFGY